MTVRVRTRPLIRAASLLLGAAIAASPSVPAQTPSTHQHTFSGAERWAHVFDDPARDAWQKPHEVIAALALPSDALVADIGAGTGYFAARLATMLPRGQVYAVDIEPDMVRYLEQRAERDKRTNMKAVLGAPGDPRLPQAVDLVLMVDVLHHIDDRVRYLGDLRRALKPAGRVAVIDFRLDSPDGPPKASRLPPEGVKAEFTQAGYRLAAEHAFLPKQYFLVFTPTP